MADNSTSSGWWGGVRDGGSGNPKNSQNTPARTTSAQSNQLQPLTKVRTAELPRNASSNLSLLGFYLGGISGGFTPSDINEMKRDPDVSLALEYLLTPILNAVVKVVGTGPEISDAQECFDKFWQHDLESFSDMFCYGYCPAEVKYKKAEPKPAIDAGQGGSLFGENDGENDGDKFGGNGADKQVSDTKNMSLVPGQGASGKKKPIAPTAPITQNQPQQTNKLEYDGMIPLEPDMCVPYVDKGEMAYIKVGDKIKLEGHTDNRPAKGFWLANDPTYSPYIGNSVLPRAWVFWRAKIGMPDSAVEVLLKANYKAAFSGLQVLYPSETIIDDDGTEYDPRAEAEWYAENIKAGTNVVLPSETDEKGKPKWEIKSYGGQPVDIEKMLPMLEWLSKQIHRGMGVVDEVITHEGNTGGYSRSNVSRQMFLMLALRRARRIAHAFDEAICKPLMKRNGNEPSYKVVVSIPGMEDDPQPGQPGQPGDPNASPGAGEPPMPGAQPGNQPGQGGTQGADSPLTALFQKTMNDEGDSGDSDGLNMSLGHFLWHEEDHPRVPAGEHGGGQFAIIGKHSPEDSKSLVSSIRAGDIRSKNSGNKTSEPDTGELAHVKMPVSAFSQETIAHLKSSTDEQRVGNYSHQKIDTPIYAQKKRKGDGFQINDGGHRLLAAIARGDTHIHALVPAEHVHHLMPVADNSKKKEVIPKYSKIVAENLQQMGTPSHEWSAVPTTGTSEAVNHKGELQSMPNFEFPQGYSKAPSMFKEDDNCCHLCGHDIKNVYWIQNHNKKWVMQVGSECVTNFGEGESGDKLAKKDQARINRDLVQQLETAARAIKLAHTKEEPVYEMSGGKRVSLRTRRAWNYGAKEEEKLHDEIKSVLGNVTSHKGGWNEKTGQRDPEMYVWSDRQVANWIKKNKEKIDDLLLKSDALLNRHAES